MAVKRLGMIISPISDTDRGIMRGVVRYVQDHGGWEIETREAVPALPWGALARWKGDGLVAMVYWENQYRALLSKRVPAVNACARLNTRKLSTVFSDNSEIGRVAAEHLLEAGLRRFAFVIRRNLYHDRARGEGFERSIRERGLPCQRIELGTKSPELHDTRDMQLLADTTEQILSIAMRCGFRSVSGFNRAFREKTGATPRQYRQRFRSTRRC